MSKNEHLRIFESKPSGLIPQLKYFEHEKSILIKSGGNSEWVKLINQEIDLLKTKILKYEEETGQLKKEVEEARSELDDSWIEIADVINAIRTKKNKILFTVFFATPFFATFLIGMGYFFAGISAYLLIGLLIIVQWSSFKLFITLIQHLRDYKRIRFELRSYENQLKMFDQEIHFAKKAFEEPKKAPGIHSENANWVNSKYWELQDSHKELSDNKRIELVQDEYKAKFGIQAPSKTQIRRYAGLDG